MARSTTTDPPSPRVGLVLGGGGIAGYSFHAAALGALLDVTGWDPRTSDVIVGTSAGSSIASLLRGHVAVDDLLTRILAVPTDPKGMAKLRSIAGRGAVNNAKFRLGPTSPMMAVRELANLRRLSFLRVISGLAPIGFLRTEVVGLDSTTLHGSDWPDETLWIPAVELGSGRRVVFGRDDEEITVSTAVQASCCLPAFFSPVRHNGSKYVDGGVHSFTNADLLVDQGLDLVVILSPMSQELSVRFPRLPDALRVIPSIHLKGEVERLRESGVEVLVIEPDDAVISSIGINPMDPTKVVSILVESSTSVFESLADPVVDAQLNILRDAAASIASPADVPYPV